MKKPGRYLLAFIIICITGVSQPAAVQGPLTAGKPVLKITVIDVWQGDSILIQFPSGVRALVDAGSGSTEYASFDAPTIDIIPLLKRERISTNGIRYFVATHPHSDHIGGAITMIDRQSFPFVYDSGMPYTTENYLSMLKAIDRNNSKYIVPAIGQKLQWDPACEVSVLNTGSEAQPNPNNNSIVLRITFGDFSMLLMGDAEREIEEEIMASGMPVTADVLKCGHHGSDTSSSDNFIDQVRPKAVFISVGLYNKFNHPVISTLEKFKKHRTGIYRTDQDGDLVVTTDGEHFVITTEKRAP